MSSKGKKAKNWEDIDENVRERILHLRTIEKGLKEKSGYNKWLKYYLGGFVTYSVFYFNLSFKGSRSDLINSKRHLFFIIVPLVAYGLVLNKIFFDKHAFKEYYDTHLELNRLIKHSVKSQEYK